MTGKEARNKLKSYREIDEDTGEEYGYQIVKSLSPDGNGYLFECMQEGTDFVCVMAVYPEDILMVPQ